MKSPHLLRVTLPPDRFVSLIEAARALKLRIGWLDWAGDLPGTSAAVSAPPDLESAEPDAADNDAWRLALPENASRRFSTVELAEALRKPHPWVTKA